MTKNFEVTEIDEVQEAKQKKADALYDEVIAMSEIMDEVAKKIRSHNPASLQYAGKASELRGASDVAKKWAKFIKGDTN